MPRLPRPLATVLATLVAVATVSPLHPAGAQAAATAPEPFVVEYYYKIKWGHTTEWLDLYKRNHYPVLLEQQKLGRIVSMSAVTPVNHAGEANRWDFRFTIVWKDAAVAHDHFDPSVILKRLYPDQDRFDKEEQRRFELLEEHLDVPVWVDDLKGWKK